MNKNPLSVRFINLLFLFLFLASVFLGFNKHSKDTFNSYHSVLWADASGYYMYLPIWFIYGNNADLINDTLVKHTGQGFRIDSEKNKIVTKYTCGTAILQMPFFLASHVCSKILGKKTDGFSPIYQWGIIIAAVFYGWLGLWFIYRFLIRYFTQTVSLTSVLAFFLCTNLYYYMLDNCGMSHIYSFFLFACIVFLTDGFIRKPSFVTIFFLCFTLVFSFLIRPTNAIMFLFPVFFNVSNKDDLKNRIKLFLSNYKLLLLSLAVSSLLFLPQFFYWHDISGKWIIYSYGEEEFINWKSPKLLELWFSTNNGLFIYAPLLFLSIAGIIQMIRKKIQNGIFLLFIFLLISYMFASWWCWWFGCAYGARSFVEYYALFIIPFAYLLSSLKTSSWKIPVWIFIAVCCFLNFDIIYYYDGCFYGGTWDLYTYFELLK